MDIDWKENRVAGRHFAFFQNTECEYFPCHETDRPETFNCLFCYCPLYALGRKCGGNFRYTQKGIKDCTGCLVPHEKENYSRITGRFSEIREVISLVDSEEGIPRAQVGPETEEPRTENSGRADRSDA